MSRDATSPSASDLPLRGPGFSLSPGERAGVWGEPTFLPQRACPSSPPHKDAPKGRMAFSHVSSQASGFVRDLWF